MTAGRLLVIRHGRTAWNRSRFLGRADVPLDAVGRAQAQTIADVLRDDRLDRIFSSPLQRARDTAAPLACAAGIRAEVRPALSELDCGDWEGIPKTAVNGRISTRDPHLPLPGGESVAQAWDRLACFRASVGLDVLPGNSVVVGHYLTNQLLVSMLLGEPQAEALRSPLYRPAPGSVAELHRDGKGWHLHAFRITALSGAL
jgi:broad specificity phosphatase PhoE